MDKLCCIVKELDYALEDIQKEAQTLLERIIKAREDLSLIKSESDLDSFAENHELEEGFEHITLF